VKTTADILRERLTAEASPPRKPRQVRAQAAPSGIIEGEDDPHRLARVFAHQFAHPEGSRLRLWSDQWYEWRNGAYGVVPERELRAQATTSIKREFDRLNQEAVQRWKSRGREGTPPVVQRVTGRLTADVAHAMASELVLPSTTPSPSWLGEEPPFPAAEVFACRNGLVHLPSWAAGQSCLSSPTPRFFTFNAIDYNFAPDAPAPTAWLNFLLGVWPEDPEAVAALQEFFGYCLLPDTSQQKILLIVGPKRSGKGTIARVLRRLIGESNAVSPTLAGLGMNFGLQPLLGKTVAVISDARLSGRTDAAVVVERLLSISGEDAQTIDRKNLPHVTTKLPIRFVVMTNELPKLNDPSGALVGRLIVERMTRSWYGAEDTGLTDRLFGELPGILLWAMEGWKRLRARGRFLQPASAARLIQDLEDLGSPIGAFVRECCEIEAGHCVLVRDLYDAWKQWCVEKGRKEAGTEQSFGRDLRATLPSLDVRQARVDSVRMREYLGIRLRVTEQPRGAESPIQTPWE
jgi:putative DNA primase/helicase